MTRDSSLLHEIRKHLKIYGFFIRAAFLQQLQYRTNLLFFILVELGYIAAKLLYVVVVQQTGVRINDLPPDSIYLFIGTYFLMTVFFVSMMQFNIIEFSNKIRNGDLDLLMVKPVSLQFMATLRHVDIFTSTPNIFLGSAMVIYGWHRMALPVDVLHIGGFSLFMLLGILMMYAIFMGPMILAFYFINVQSLNSIAWSLWDFNNMPHKIHPNMVQRIGVYILPIFLITNFSPLFAMDRLSGGEIAWACVAPFLLLWLVRKFWNRSVAHYESASS